MPTEVFTVYTVAVIGAGARGGNVYARLMNRLPERYKVTHICDIDEDTLAAAGDEFQIPETHRYSSETDFFRRRRADIIVIATPDDCHVRHALKAMELGYDILCEKPITDKIDECEALLAAQRKYGNKILVCHVLRYAASYSKLKSIIDSGTIGRLVSMDWIEPVGYWHQAHSFVRGTWRNTKNSAPMIIAKCCHDLDMIQYFAGSKCKSVSSFGDLTFFKPQNAPEGSAKRCSECGLKDTCPYSAYLIYIEGWKKKNCPPHYWPYNVLVEEPVTEDKLLEAIEYGPYGRCVFHCDNNVVDHQTVSMLFENGITATLQMNAFNVGGGRRISVFGTYGEAYMTDKEIVLNVYGKPTEVIDVAVYQHGLDYAHGGGDARMIAALYDMVSGEKPLTTALEASIESHLIGIKAEQSRLAGGAVVAVHDGE